MRQLLRSEWLMIKNFSIASGLKERQVFYNDGNEELLLLRKRQRIKTFLSRRSMHSQLSSSCLDRRDGAFGFWTRLASIFCCHPRSEEETRNSSLENERRRNCRRLSTASATLHHFASRELVVVGVARICRRRRRPSPSASRAARAVTSRRRRRFLTCTRAKYCSERRRKASNWQKQK